MADNKPQPPSNFGDPATIARTKLSRIYEEEEPNAKKEILESEQSQHRSEHQEFIYRLNNSGKDMATIQTEWHNYYQTLPEAEKHKVWQEFYSSQSALTGQAINQQNSPRALAEHKHQSAGLTNKHKQQHKKKLGGKVKDRVSAGGKLKARHHLQSLLFGLGMGAIVLFIMLFSFFNEFFIAPFIQPARASNTPIIVSNDTVAPSATPEVIIPKINVQIPVDYSQTSTNEADIENGLENGVVHYPTTSKPGENGNAAFFGHSSNNIFNKGKYKFAFVMLRTLVVGDTFYLTYNSIVYAYKVISRDVVDPSNIGVLNPGAGQTATATLITCDPPGTSLKRLVVVGQQISPDPASNAQASGTSVAQQSGETLPGNGPTLFGRFISTFIGKLLLLAMMGGVFFAGFKWLYDGRKT